MLLFSIFLGETEAERRRSAFTARSPSRGTHFLSGVTTSAPHRLFFVLVSSAAPRLLSQLENPRLCLFLFYLTGYLFIEDADK